ncbi:deadenylation-dependent mRNA-decapping factor PAT1 ASCRUDRAFT_21023, partial [Ascoidea rubescens DSM 1968]
EERERLIKRSNKIARIIKYSNIMNARDKDFVTRFQLAQIVTEDPYNEDFYFQIYKAINSNNGLNSDSELNQIAKYYLENSGHRLGGRHKRVDLALQRMQQQVQKAVTVAKERPKSGQLSRDGSLGKIAFASGKMPRKKLEILEKVDSPKESHSRIEDSLKTENDSINSHDSKSNLSTPIITSVSINNQNLLSPNISSNLNIKKLTPKVVLGCIEVVYSEVLILESLERAQKEINTANLWKSLHINDSTQMSHSNSNSNSNSLLDESYEIENNLFVLMLNYNKGVKFIPRLFHYLSHDEKFGIVQKLYEKFHLLNVVKESSYKNYYKSSTEKQNSIDKKVDLFLNLGSKNILNFISNELSFNEIIKTLMILLNNFHVRNSNYSDDKPSIIHFLNNKIGLSLLTILISKVELLKQQVDASILNTSKSMAGLTVNDIVIWNQIYDTFFRLLQNNLLEVFPKNLYTDDSISFVKNTESVLTFDDSYIWQFLASLALSGKLQHQRIIIDEIRDKIFGVVTFAKKLQEHEDNVYFKEESIKKLKHLNLFLNVMGLNANENGDISELK